MCGIFGTIEFEGGTSREELEERTRKAVRALAHRGPNDESVWVSSCGRVSLGHRRLLTVGRNSRSVQSLVSQSGRTVATIDGELYNFRELRSQYSVLSKGDMSDTEVLLELIDSQGSQALPLLEGKFAVGAFDQTQRKLLLAVDPAGQKPLYIYQDNRRIIFASEIKAIKAFGNVDLSVNKDAIKESLIYGYVPQPRTIYNNIRKLSPGHWQVVDLLDGIDQPVKYWDLPLLGPENLGSEAQIIEELQQLIQKAVQRRLVENAPNGVFLSGGLDSSVIAYEASQLNLHEKLKTFAVGFLKSSDKEDCDESRFSRYVATMIRSDHTELQVDPGTINLDQILRHIDEPFGSSGCFLNSVLCAEASRHVGVALSGEGANELFGGHWRLQAAVFTEEHLRLLRALLKYLPIENSRRKNFLGYVGRVSSTIGHPLMERLLLWNSCFQESDLSTFFGSHFELKMSEAEKFEELTRGVSTGRRALYLNFKSYLFDNLLPMVDRMSMLHGLEVRCPFLDKELVEFAFLLPTSKKFDTRSSKKILKNAYRKHLGSKIVDRPRQDFSFPMSDFIDLKVRGEDFRKLEEFGVKAKDFPITTSTPLGRSQFFALYALEGFLKQMDIQSEKENQRLELKQKLQSLFAEEPGASFF